MQVAKSNRNFKSGARKGSERPQIYTEAEEYVSLLNIKELREEQKRDKRNTYCGNHSPFIYGSASSKPHKTGGIFQRISTNSEWSQRNENLISPLIAGIWPQSSTWQELTFSSMKLVIFLSSKRKYFTCLIYLSPETITWTKSMVSPIYTYLFFTKCPKPETSISFKVQQFIAPLVKKIIIFLKKWVTSHVIYSSKLTLNISKAFN